MAKCNSKTPKLASGTRVFVMDSAAIIQGLCGEIEGSNERVYSLKLEETNRMIYAAQNDIKLTMHKSLLKKCQEAVSMLLI